MILSAQVLDASKSHVSWLDKLPKTKFDFSPGLNILLGPNGSGKSTLLRTLAQYLHCAQGGIQVVTTMSRTELFSFMLRGKVDDLKAAFSFEYDGSPTIYFDAHATMGLQGSGFDDDFFEKGIHSAMFKGSGGQSTYFKLDDALSYMVGKTPLPSARWKCHRGETETDAYIQAVLDGNIEKVGPTFIFDEPELSLDPEGAYRLWGFLRAAAKKYQVLVATHSPFALGLKDATYHAFEKDYLVKVDYLYSDLSRIAFQNSDPRLK